MATGLALSPSAAVTAASQLLLGLVAAVWGWLAALLAAYERTVGTLAGAGVGLLEGLVAACLRAGETAGGSARAGLTRPEGRAAAAAAVRPLAAELPAKGRGVVPASTPTAPATPPRVLRATATRLATPALAPQRTASAALQPSVPSSRADSVASGASVSAASLPSSHPVALASWASHEGPLSHPLVEDEPAAASPTAASSSAAAAAAPPPQAHTPAALTAEAVRVVSVTPLGEPRTAAKDGKKKRGPLGRALHQVKKALA